MALAASASQRIQILRTVVLKHNSLSGKFGLQILFLIQSIIMGEGSSSEHAQALVASSVH
jgi:hypothetical protein